MAYADTAQQSLPYAPQSETSRESAIAAGAFATNQREQYFRWLQSKGDFGGTDGEAERQLKLRRSSVCARRNELRTAARVVKTDRRRDGCEVWRTL